MTEPSAEGFPRAATAVAEPDPSLAVRPPRQERSRQSWARVLDAGVAILEEVGYDGFTIAAVCERAAVPPRALYARVDTKDALFLAVYEHGMAAVRQDHRAAFEEVAASRCSAEETADRAVRAVASVFEQHAALLRAVVLISGAHPEVYRRGAHYGRELWTLWSEVLLRHKESMTAEEPTLAVSAAYDAVFAQMVVRTAYGPGFSAVSSHEDQVAALAMIVRSYLF